MSSTDPTDADRFFAAMLLSLRHAMTRRGQSFFPSAPDPKAESYWQPVATRTSGVQELPAEHDGAAMLRLLGDYWRSKGDAPMTRMLAELEKLRQSTMTVSEAKKDEVTEVTDFVYPMH